MNRRFGVALLVAALASQFGCLSSTIKEVEIAPLSAEAQARFADLSPQAAISEGEERIKAAYIAELDLYSPQYLKRAEELLQAARQAHAKRDIGKEAVFVQILALERALERAEATKTAVLRQMAEVFELRRALDRIDAEHYKQRLYNKLMERIRLLISHIEAERDDKFRDNLPELVEDMRAFETDTIVHNALNTAALALEEADGVDADEYAPDSFAKAKLTYTRAEKRIRANPHDSETVQRLGRDALVEARHAFYVAKAVVVLQEVRKDEMERIVLAEESRLGRIAEVLSVRQIHDRSLDDQAAALVAAVTALLKSAQRPAAADGDGAAAEDEPSHLERESSGGGGELEEIEPGFVDLSSELPDETDVIAPQQ